MIAEPLHALLARVEAAEGPERDLDREIHAALGLPGDLVVHAGAIWNAYTASIDAAVALVQRVLPAANCYGIERDPRAIEAYVSRNNVGSGHWYFGAEHRTSAPLALCAALLKAEIARAEDAATPARQTSGAAHE